MCTYSVQLEDCRLVVLECLEGDPEKAQQPLLILRDYVSLATEETGNQKGWPLVVHSTASRAPCMHAIPARDFPFP